MIVAFLVLLGLFLGFRRCSFSGVGTCMLAVVGALLLVQLVFVFQLVAIALHFETVVKFAKVGWGTSGVIRGVRRCKLGIVAAKTQANKWFSPPP